MIIAALLATCALYVQAAVPVPGPELDAYAWEQACAYAPYDCTDVEPPVVVYSNAITGTIGVYGIYFFGEDYVYISTEYRPPHDIARTVIHEMTHYLQEQAGVIRTMGMCASEGEAFRLGDEWMVDNGYEPYSDGWEERYGCEESPE